MPWAPVARIRACGPDPHLWPGSAPVARIRTVWGADLALFRFMPDEATPTAASPSAEMARTAEIFRRILVPVDFSVESHRAIFTALELRRRFGSELGVFNLTEFDENDDFRRGLGHEFSTSNLTVLTEHRIHDFLENLQPGASQGITAMAFVGHDVARWLSDLAKEWRATLVLLATHPSHKLLRTTTEKILRGLDIPVLVPQ